jgi:hypothetical protein
LEEYDILKCVEKGLAPFGPHAKQTVYWRISILHHSLQNTVISNPSTFTGVLQDVFGDSAVAVEESIIKELQMAFDLSEENGDLESFEHAIRAAKRKISFGLSGQQTQVQVDLREKAKPC